MGASPSAPNGSCCPCSRTATPFIYNGIKSKKKKHPKALFPRNITFANNLHLCGQIRDKSNNAIYDSFIVLDKAVEPQRDPFFELTILGWWAWPSRVVRFVPTMLFGHVRLFSPPDVASTSCSPPIYHLPFLRAVSVGPPYRVLRTAIFLLIPLYLRRDSMLHVVFYFGHLFSWCLL